MTNESLWHLYKKMLIFIPPPHKMVKTSDLLPFCGLSKKEMKGLLKENNAWLIRWTTDFDHEESNFWHVIKDYYGGFEELSSNTRNQVRKSFKKCQMQRITKSFLIEHGYDVYKSAFERYSSCDIVPSSKESWKKGLIEEEQSRDYWGALDIDTKKLIAYAVNKIDGDMCCYLTLKAHGAYIKTHLPYYGLIFRMNEYYLCERKLLYVTDGERTLTKHSHIQDFLIAKFKFRKAYCKLHVVYVWWLRIIITMLYPFRNSIKNVKIKSILNLEEYRYKN
jgi:hypothetical protein